MALDNNEFSDQQLVVSDSVKVPSVDGNASGFILCLALLEYIRGRLNKSDVGLSNVPNYDFTDRMNAVESRTSTIEGKIPSYDSHIASEDNPHGVTKAQVGLGNVDNTSDANKPISNAAQTALDNKANKAITLAGYGIGDAYTKTAVDNLLSGYLKMPIQDNAGFHNSLYRGRDITSYWTDGSLWDRIQGTNGRKLFEDLYVGDWFSTGTHSINGVSADQCFMIGGFDLRRGVGANNVTKHHIVPVACNATGTDTRALFSSQMYAEVPFTGAYQGSIVHPLFLPDGAASTDLKAIFGSHLLQSSELISTANNSNGYGRYGSASGVSTSWAWVDVCGILMSEVEVYGSIVWSSSGYDGGTSSRGQLPLFRLRPDLISSRSFDFWLRDATVAYAFASVDGYGYASYYTATGSFSVRPRFLIG